MLRETLIEIFERDLLQLKKEIESYSDESKLWIITEGISNSAGNLCLHLTGNLNHFIGATLGNTGYVRNRDNEFLLKDIPRKELIGNIEKTIAVNNSNNLGVFAAKELLENGGQVIADQIRNGK